MADLVVIVPSRCRPHAVAEMAEAFEKTCTQITTDLVFAVDADDPNLVEYEAAIATQEQYGILLTVGAPSSMVRTLNVTAGLLLEDRKPSAVGFFGDDHRPRTRGWDRAYLDALAAKPGIVYGNDLIQGEQLPTQCAMSSEIVRALGHMAPPVLTHLYADNYWRDLGKAAGCLTYLPDIIVEHVHPASGKVDMDDGYRRVNAPEMYERDSNAYRAYMAEHGGRDVAAVRQALAGALA